MLSLGRRWLLAGLTLAGVAAAGLGAAKLEVDVSNESLFVQGDPELVRYRELKALFGSDETLYVLVEVEDPFADPERARLLELGRDLARLPFVESVRSPLRSPVSFSEGDAIVSRSLAEALPVTEAERATWRARVLGYEPFRGLLISDDARYVGHVVRLEPLELTTADRARLADAVAELLAGYPDLEAAAVGTPINTVLVGRLLARELLWAFSAGLGVALLVLWLLLRSLRALGATLAVVLLTQVATFGLMGHMGRPLSTLSSILVTLLICVGIADCMHLLASQQRLARRGRGPRWAFALALRQVWRPCLATSLTTAAGFLALVPSGVAPVANLGLFSAVGVVVAYGVMLGVLPLLVGGWDARRGWRLGTPRSAAAARWGPAGSRNPPDAAERLLGVVRRAAEARPGTVALAAAVLLAAACAGLPRLHVDQSLLRDLEPDEPLRRSLEFVHDRMGGTISAEVVLLPDRPGDGAQLALLLRRLADFEGWLRELHPAIRSVTSVADGVEEMHVLFDGPREVPEDPEAVAQLLLMVQSGDARFYEQFITIDGAALRATIRFDLIGSREYAQALAQIEERLQEVTEGVGRGYLTGGAMLLARTNRYLLETQVEGFLLALAVVSGLLLVTSGSLRLGLLALLPNVGPIAFVLGLMGWLGIAIEVGNVLVAPIAMGIVVDDTIHFLHHYRRSRRQGLEPARAADRTVTGAGRAILYTSLVLVLCFLTYAGADLRGIRVFGLLCAVTFVAAFLADLLVLPALIRLTERRRSPAA